jgi:hypothetical protein
VHLVLDQPAVASGLIGLAKPSSVAQSAALLGAEPMMAD